MAFDRKAKRCCLPLVATFVAGLILCAQPSPSAAHTTATASATSNCIGPLDPYQPTEKPVKAHGVRNEGRNIGNSGSCRHKPTAQEPVSGQQGEKGHQSDSESECQPDPYDGEYLAEGKVADRSCRGPTRLRRGLESSRQRPRAIRNDEVACVRIGARPMPDARCRPR